MPKCRLFSIFSVKSLFILAVVVALNACDSGNAQVRAAGNTIKRPIQGEPRDAVSVEGRRQSQVAPAAPRLVRAYLVTDNLQVAQFIRRTGNALKFGAKSHSPSQRTYYTSAPENLRLVDYVTLVDGSTYAADGVGPEHTLSMAGAMAWAYYFSKITQQQDDTLKQAANELYRTYSYETNEWTRPTAPASGATAYRNSPPRRYNWTYKTSGSLSWCLSDVRWVQN